MDEESSKEKLKKLMYNLDIASYNDLCVIAGIKDIYVIPKYLSHKIEISISQMFKLANALKVKIDTIIDVFYSDELKENNKIYNDYINNPDMEVDW